MLKFVEEENIACAGTKPSKHNDKGDEDNGDKVIYLEPQPRRMIKKKETQKKTFFVVPSLQMKDIQSWINYRYNPDGGDQVHCSTYSGLRWYVYIENKNGTMSHHSHN